MLRSIDRLQSQGNAGKALDLVERGLAHEQPKERIYWDLVLRKAEILEQMKRRQEALTWLVDRPPTNGTPADLTVRLIREQAALESGVGRFHDADRHLKEGIARARASGQARMAATLTVRRARVLLWLDQPEAAEGNLTQAEEYVRNSGDRTLEPYILHYRGLVRVSRNQFEDAVPPLEASLSGFRGARQAGLAANVIISLAWCYYRLGQFEKAEARYREALGMADAQDRHLVLGHLGNMSLEQGDYAAAANYYQQAARLAEGQSQEYQSKWLNDLAQALIDQERWPDAERYNNQALELEKKIDGSPGLALALVNSARIEAAKGHLSQAEQSLERVAKSGDGDAAFALAACGQLAALYASAGRAEAAKLQFNSALAMADKTRGHLREDENKLAYLSSLIDLNRQYVDFLMDGNDAAGAFAVAESSRARLLRERLDFEGSRPRSHSIAEYQAAARTTGTTFLSYWIGPKRSYLWAISAAGLATFRLPAEAEIRVLVGKYQNAIEAGAPIDDAQAAVGAKLFRLLLAQNAGVLKPKGTYVIEPDGPLYSLNFETLPVADNPGHYWIEEATVAVAPSLDMLLGRRSMTAAGRSLLLVGDADEWSTEYPKLLHARQEMEGIKAQLPSPRKTVLMGAAATPAAYQRAQPAQYAYIHFAAHATANKNSPFDSAIILSRSEDQAGGKLSVKEVLHTPVHAELVTISACHSAGSHTYWGEGLVGFTWAFLQSGARGVIAGLWDVSDYSSPVLMRDLYAGLAASQSPADALRAAKLRMIESHGKYASPYYWGAFQLYEGAL